MYRNDNLERRGGIDLFATAANEAAAFQKFWEWAELQDVRPLATVPMTLLIEVAFF